MGGGEVLPSHDVGSSETESLLVRVITHNIRYAATDLFEYEKPWSDRLPNLIRQFYHFTTRPFNPSCTIICLQEVLAVQLKDISEHLNKANRLSSSTWAHVGVGRDDGKSSGEFNPIFYRSDTWDKVHFETIWLSETPNKVSRGWDGGCNRLCTCLILRTKTPSTQTVMFLNTHLDNTGVIARRKGATLIVNYTKKWRDQHKPDHILMTGDLNSTKDEVDGAWQTFNGQDSGFVDIERMLDAGDVRRYGDEATYTGFDGSGDGDEVSVLDFVHYGLEVGEGIMETRDKLHAYTIAPNLFDDGTRCSDHRAVIVDLLL